MWEFVAHKFVQPTRWSWAHISKNGRTIQRSPVAYESFGNALSSATRHGFDRNEHEYVLIELQGDKVEA
jgi:hypothetical protein